MGKKDMLGSELIIAEDGTLYHINLKSADNIPTNIFFVGDTGRVPSVAAYFDQGVEFEAHNREYITAVGRYHGIPMAVMSTGIGTDNVEIASVELHALWEFDHKEKIWKGPPAKTPNIIRIGTSGCPQGDIPIGSLAITTYAIGLDNTGKYYPKDDFGSKLSKEILEAEIALTALSSINPYISRATDRVAQALMQGCEEIGLVREEGRGFYVGMTSSASGFYSPQGRQIGRLPILIPDLQEILAGLKVGELRVINNEMEASSMCRILGECLGYNVGVVCAILANRNTGEFVPAEEYKNSVDRAIQAAFHAMEKLALS